MYPTLNSKQISERLIPIIIQKFQYEPWSAIQAILSPFHKVLKPDAPLLLGFMAGYNNIALFTRVCYVLLYIGLVISLFRYRRRTYSLFLFSFLGIFLSVPLVSYISYRVVASTMPLTFCTVAVGAAFLIEKLTKKPAGIDTSDFQKSKFDYILLMAAVGVIGWMMIMPVITTTIKPNPANVIDSCDQGISLTTTGIKGSYIRIIADSAGSATRVPDIDKTSFIWSNPAPDAWWPGFKQALESVDVGSTIFSNIYLRALIIIPKNLSFDENADLSLCLSRVNSFSNLLIATSVKPVRDIYWIRKLALWGITGALIVIYVITGYYVLRKRTHLSKGENLDKKE